MESKSYDWKYSNLGGMARVKIETGEDIAHLHELDQKLWTVLSCPTEGLEFDAKTLKSLDSDADGKIRVNEVVAAADMLCAALTDKEVLVKGVDTLPLSAFNQENEQGAKLYKSAKQILENLGIESDSISIKDSSDSVAIFAKTRFNGDGVITVATPEDEPSKEVITNIINTVGSVADRSGEAGVNEELIEKFYAACADYAAWIKDSKDNAAAIAPYGENTATALDACNAVNEKVADYFMRCKLVKFDADSAAALDVSVDRISAISANNLTACGEEIASYPLARVSGAQELKLEAINPAWQAAMDKVKALVLDVDYPGAESITEAQWNAVMAKFGAYTAWAGAKKGAEVEALGIEAVEATLAADLKAGLLALVEQDKALAEEAGAIDAVDNFLHLVCNFHTFLRNYVTLADFYDKDKKAVFQAGTLYIDQRSCDLCVRVADMGKHGNMAGLSGMFIAYCDCVSKTTGKKLSIAAVLTDGDVKDVRVGKNAIFYDRNGLDYDATVTKIVDNPISIRQAFWAPYRKFANWVTETINKFAADKDSKVLADAKAKASDVKVPAAGADAAAPAKPQAFDIAKFAGIFAAIGMALGMIASAVAGVFESLKDPWYTIFIVIPAIMLIISGPSCFLAWGKLRKRNLAPVLNANGWAINSKALVNIKFGATLTSMAKFPKVGKIDPAQRAKKARRRLVWLTICFIIAVCCALYFTNTLAAIGLPFEGFNCSCCMCK